jgi:CheY-like chemotaxis protein
VNEWTAAVIGMAIIALVIFALILLHPEDVAAFVRGVSKFKWGLSGIEIERDLAAAAEKGGTPNDVRSALSNVPLSGRILWVDDHPEHNLAEIDLLRRRGLTIDMVSTNAAASAVAKLRHYNLVVSDIGRDNDADDPVAGLKLPDVLAQALVGDRPPVVFYTSNPADTGIPQTIAVSTPGRLFAAIARYLDDAPH